MFSISFSLIFVKSLKRQNLIVLLLIDLISFNITSIEKIEPSFLTPSYSINFSKLFSKFILIKSWCFFGKSNSIPQTPVNSFDA